LPDGKHPLLSASPFRPLEGTTLQTLMKAELVEQAALIVKETPLLINMVSKRVKQLTSGHAPLVDRRPGMREADVALLEIIQGKIKMEPHVKAEA
jgi:DNA-directed RNA polymerase subunit omega